MIRATLLHAPDACSPPGRARGLPSLRSAAFRALAWAALLAAPLGAAVPQGAPAYSGPLGVSIGRDAHGVPHVFAKTDEGALFGLGYATAQDRLFQMSWMRLVARGRLSEFLGPGTVAGPGGAPKKTHVISDRKARLFGWSRHASRVVAAMDGPARKLLTAYAEGVNAFLQDHLGNYDPLFTQFNVPVEPWTPEDCVLAWIRFGDFFASSGLDEGRLLHEWQALLATPGLSLQERLDQLQGYLVCDDSAAVIDESDVPEAHRDLLRAYAAAHQLGVQSQCLPYHASPHFSQAWAVSGARTTTGRAVLVGDPRIGVTLPSQLYEWMVQGENFCVRGVGVAGSPNVLSGMTPDMAWSPTALGVDQSDLLLLITDPVGHAGQYQLDGQWMPFQEASLETIHVQGEPDEVVQYRSTWFGPVVTGAVQDVHAGEEYAIRRVPLDDPARDPFAGFLRLFRSRDLDTFHGALEGWTFPSVNLVFADAHGRIGYSIAGALPVRNPKLQLGGVIAQSGATVESDWIDILPHALAPHVLDPARGTLFSANHRPVGSWYPIPIRYGSGGSGDTFRSRRLRELLSDPRATFDPKDVFELHFDIVGVGPRDLTEIGLWLRTHNVALSLDARRALNELGPWLSAGSRMDSQVRGVLIASSMDLSFRESTTGSELAQRYGGGENGLNLFLKQCLAKIRALPPVPLTPAEVAFVDVVLADAVRTAQAVGPTSVWQSWYRNNVLTVLLPRWTSLEGFPSLFPGLTVPMGPFRAVDLHTLLSPLRQSYTQFVEFGGDNLRLSVAPPGSAEPSSAHDIDQANLWVTEQFKAGSLSRRELLNQGPVTWKHL
jgi:acyl-homoserine lactone acylase PvdQ